MLTMLLLVTFVIAMDDDGRNSGLIALLVFIAMLGSCSVKVSS